MKIRPVTEQDKPEIDEWISRDPDHSAKDMTSDYFDALESFCIEDEDGPIMYVGIEWPQWPDRALARLHIQFNEGQQTRTGTALLRAFPIVKEVLRLLGCSQIIFESVSRPLIAFTKRRFGFRRVPGTDDYITGI